MHLWEGDTVESVGHGNKGYGMDALSFDSNSNTFQGLQEIIR